VLTVPKRPCQHARARSEAASGELSSSESCNDDHGIVGDATKNIANAYTSIRDLITLLTAPRAGTHRNPSNGCRREHSALDDQVTSKKEFRKIHLFRSGPRSRVKERHRYYQRQKHW